MVTRKQCEQRAQQNEAEHLRPKLRLQKKPARRREQDHQLDGERRAGRGLGIGDQQQSHRRAEELPQLEPGHAGDVIHERHHDFAEPFVIAPSMTTRGV